MDGDRDLDPMLDCKFKEAHEKVRVLLRDLLVKIPSELWADCEKLHLEVLWQAECMFNQFLIQMTADSKKFFEELKRKMLTQLKSDEEIRKVHDEIVALLRSEFIQDCNFNSKATRDGNQDAMLDCKFNDLDAMLDCKFNEVHEKFNEVHEKICVLLRDLLVKIPSEVRADCEKLHLEVLWQAEAMFNQFLIQMAADFKKFFEEEKREMLTQLKSDEEIRKMREEIVAQLRSEIKQDQDRKGLFEEEKREMLTRLKNDEEIRKRLLENSKVLERFTLHTLEIIEDEEEMVNEIRNLPRASPICKIEFVMYNGCMKSFQSEVHNYRESFDCTGLRIEAPFSPFVL